MPSWPVLGLACCAALAPAARALDDGPVVPPVAVGAASDAAAPAASEPAMATADAATPATAVPAAGPATADSPPATDDTAAAPIEPALAPAPDAASVEAPASVPAPAPATVEASAPAPVAPDAPAAPAIIAKDAAVPAEGAATPAIAAAAADPALTAEAATAATVTPLAPADAPPSAPSGTTATAAEARPPYAPVRAPYTPARSKAEIEAERILFPDLAGPPPGGDHYGPPRLLSPGTPRDSRSRPLVLAPALATQEPIPGAGAGNCVRRDERGRFMGWMDRQQCVFSGRAMVTARWVDDLFGDWHDDEATMMARLRSHTVWTEGEGIQTRLSLSAKVSLPNARRRFRLIVSDESDEDPAGRDVRRQLLQEDSRMSAALRWIALDRGGLVSNFDVGARGFDPVDVFARYRLAKTWSLSDDALARLSQTLRYGSDSKERYTPVLDFERALDEHSAVAFTNYYDYRHATASDGFAWTHGISYSHALGNSRSYSYGFALSGVTHPDWRGESYGPWAIYRQPFLRPWLFLEVEPHYTWYRARDWDALASLVLRLEMQFGWNRD